MYAKSLFSNNSQADNSKYIEALKELTIATQKTRGLTNSYLNGNISALLLIYGNKDEMKKAIGTMESLPLASDPIVNKRATEISHSLIELNHKALKRQPAEVFENYTELIEKLLLLAQTVSKHGSEDLNPLGKDASNVMMEVILPLTEYIGQLRGMGSGIIAKGSIDEKQKYKVAAIMNEMENLSSKFQTDMATISSKYKEHYPSDINDKLSIIKISIQKYTDLAKTEVLQPNSTTTNPDAYFNEGTNNITLLINVFDINNKAVLDDSKGWL
jgi:hypothetical protein